MNIRYIMLKNFNISLIELWFLDLNYVYDLMDLHRKEEKSKEFLQMHLAGVDLSKSEDYLRFIGQSALENEPKNIDPEEMEDMEDLSLKILEGGKNG